MHPFRKSQITRPFLALAILFSLIGLSIYTLTGCGSSGGRSSSVTVSTIPASQGRGKATFTVDWPVRVASRLIPSASNSIVVKLTKADGTGLAEQRMSRPASGGTTTADFAELPAGELIARVVAYPNSEGTGVAQASASASVTIEGGKTATLSLTLDSTIDRLEVTPSPLALTVGQNAILVVTAKNLAGEIVLTDSGKITFASDNDGVAAVDSVGKVAAGSNAGTSIITVKETESGKTMAVTVSVSALPASILQKSVAYQIDASHRGRAVFGQPLIFPSQPLWNMSVDGFGVPLIADGRLIVTAVTPRIGNMSAYDLKTGTRLWGPIPVRGDAVYDNDTIFVPAVDPDLKLVVLAIDPATGNTRWRSKMPGPTVQTALLATSGLVFGNYSVGDIYFEFALDQSSGAVKWTKDYAAPSGRFDTTHRTASPDGELLLLSQVWQFLAVNAQTGAVVWKRNTVSTTHPSVCGNGRIYPEKAMIGESGSALSILDLKSGASTGAYGTRETTGLNDTLLPVLSPELAFFLKPIQTGYSITAVDINTNQNRWTVEDNGFPNGNLLIDNTLFVAKRDNTIKAWNSATGGLLWSGIIGGTRNPIAHRMAAGEGYLVTQSDERLTVFQLAGPK